MLYSELNIKERKGLCLAFAKRFASQEDRETLLDQSGIDWPHAFSWDVLLYSISEHPKVMQEFLSTARKLTRKDHYFQEILYLLEPSEKPTSWISNMGTFMGIALAIGGTLYVGQYNLTESKIPEQNSPLAFSPMQMLQPIQEPIIDNSEPLSQKLLNVPTNTKTVSTDRHSTHSSKDRTAPLKSQAKLSKLGISEADLDPSIVPHNDDSATKSDIDNLSMDSKAPRCQLHGNGDLIGYWYVGADMPEIINHTTIVPGGRNVRLDYPKAENGYNSRAPVNCVLFANTVVSVKEAPIFVDGNRYWVALFSQSNG